MAIQFVDQFKEQYYLFVNHFIKTMHYINDTASEILMMKLRIDFMRNKMR